MTEVGDLLRSEDERWDDESGKTPVYFNQIIPAESRDALVREAHAYKVVLTAALHDFALPFEPFHRIVSNFDLHTFLFHLEPDADVWAFIKSDKGAMSKELTVRTHRLTVIAVNGRGEGWVTVHRNPGFDWHPVLVPPMVGEAVHDLPAPVPETPKQDRAIRFHRAAYDLTPVFGALFIIYGMLDWYDILALEPVVDVVISWTLLSGQAVTGSIWIILSAQLKTMIPQGRWKWGDK